MGGIQELERHERGRMQLIGGKTRLDVDILHAYPRDWTRTKFKLVAPTTKGIQVLRAAIAAED